MNRVLLSAGVILSTGLCGVATAGVGVYIGPTTSTGVYVESAGGGSGVYVGDALYYGLTAYSIMLSNECCYPAGVEGYGYNYSAIGGERAYGLYGYAYREGPGQARGVFGQASAASGGVAYAGYFAGDINVTGNVFGAAITSRMDHPIDPANLYLYHSVVQSSELLDIYSGNVILDQHGEASIEMPSWFEALNGELRYQLTAIGAAAPNLHIAEKVQDNRFTIAGGQPDMEVSWQISAVRRDPRSNDHPLEVEGSKPDSERGTYLYPQGYGMPETMALEYRERAMEEAQRALAHLP